MRPPVCARERGGIGVMRRDEWMDRGNMVIVNGRSHLSGFFYHYLLGLVGSMPLQFLEVGFHVEIHAIEWHDFERETQFHGVVVA